MLSPKPFSYRSPLIILLSLLTTCLLIACSSGGGDSDDDNNDSPSAPDPVDFIVTNRGDTATSVGWEYSGEPGVSFVVEVEPTTPVAVPAPPTINMNGNGAMLSNLLSNVTYAINVRTHAAGQMSEAVSTQITPSPISSASYTPISVGNDPSISGIFDPSFYRDDTGTIWMAYSGVDFYLSNGDLVQDVSTRLARSDDNGASFTLVTSLGNAGIATVTDVSATLGCTNNVCDGRWVYEVPFLVDDIADPDTAARFKIFAHKYFLLPGANPSTIYFLGALVMWTAPTPDSAWSDETVVMQWNLSPPELSGGINLNQLHTAIGDCIVFSEGGASAGVVDNQNIIEFVFSCPYPDSSANTIRQRVVQLRSTDHGQTFTYVGIPLTAADALPAGAEHYSAPSLLPRIDAAPILLVTPVENGLYAGCKVFSYSDFSSADIARINGDPTPLLSVPQLADHFGGACAWDREMDATGISLNIFDINLSMPFTIQRSGHAL